MKTDLLVRGGHLFTMQGAGVGYVADGAVAVDRGQIVAVGSQAELANEYEAEQIVDAQHHAILPGLIDAHMHLHLALLRGLAQDTQNWLPYRRHRAGRNTVATF